MTLIKLSKVVAGFVIVAAGIGLIAIIGWGVVEIIDLIPPPAGWLPQSD